MFKSEQMVTVMKYINFEQHTYSIPNVIYCHVRGKVAFIIAHLLIYMIILKTLKSLNSIVKWVEVCI